VWTRVTAFGVILGVLALYVGTVNPFWRPSWDSAVYLTLARSIADGEGYRYLGYAHGLYPPALSVMLAGIFATVGTSYTVMRLAMLLLAAVGAVSGYYLVRRRASRIQAFVVAATFAVCYPLVDSLTYVLSDVPFASLVLVILALFERSREQLVGWRLGALVVLIVACVLFRTATVALVGSAVLFGLSRWMHTRQFRHAVAWGAVGAAGLLTAGTWTMWANAELGREPIPPGLPGYRYHHPTYMAQFMLAQPTRSDSKSLSTYSYANRVLRNVRFYAKAISADMLGIRRGSVELGLTSYAILLVPFMGFLHQARTRAGPAELFLLFYTFMLLIWPWRYQRFLLPVLPLLFLYTFNGMEALFGAIRTGMKRLGAALPRVPETWPSRLAVVLLATAGMMHAFSDLEIIAHERARPCPPRPGDRAIVGASRWLAEEAGEDDVVVCFQAAIVHWLSGLTSFAPPWTDPPDVQLGMIRESSADWIVINPLIEVNGGYLKQLIEQRPDLFALSAVVEGAEIYRVLEAAAEHRDASQ